ncbi:MAG: hypothetical protein Q4F37_05710 [Corynebacterium sp.]|nr:hypothetical protein [Corynebacterium sp.]
MDSRDIHHGNELPREVVDRELEILLHEAETTVAALRAELRRRKEQAQQDNLAAQHLEIDRLAEHLENATVRWNEVKDFFVKLTMELRKEEK